MTGVYVKIVGSTEEVLYLSRVPTIGEHVTACGLPRRVAVVLHHPLPAPEGVYQLTTNVPVQWSPPWALTIAATVTVEDA